MSILTVSCAVGDHQLCRQSAENKCVHNDSPTSQNGLLAEVLECLASNPNINKFEPYLVQFFSQPSTMALERRLSS